MFLKSSNRENAESFQESLKKTGVFGDLRNGILMEEPMQQYAKRPGLREIKQVEMYKKYRSLVPAEYRAELCPEPAKEVLDREKKRKNAKSKAKLKPTPSPPSEAEKTKLMPTPSPPGQELTCTQGTTNNTTVPSSPPSRENAELE
jgi:hypothetical protein